MVKFVSDQEARENDPFADAPRRQVEYASKSLYDQLKESKEQKEKSSEEQKYQVQPVTDEEVHFLKEQDRSQQQRDEQIRQTEADRLRRFKQHVAEAEAASQAPAPPSSSSLVPTPTDPQPSRSDDHQQKEQLVRTDVVGLSAVKMVPQRKKRRPHKRRRPSDGKSRRERSKKRTKTDSHTQYTKDPDGKNDSSVLLAGGGLVGYDSE